jgi:predicted CXXCH cytochrome family protein
MTTHGHLNGVDYASVRLKNPGAALRPESDVIDRGVPLRNGTIRCLTCHEARSSPTKLILPPQRLCVACHAFD